MNQHPGSLTALTLAADVAHALDGDGDRAAELLDEAAKLAADPGHRVELAEHFGFAGRVAEGLDLVEPLRAERMDDLATWTVYADLLEMAQRRVVGRGDLPAECPCRSGGRWRDCCRPRELAALRRFDDRTRFEELREAVAEHVEGDPTLAEVVGEHVRQWLELVEDATAEERQLVAALATEHAWLAGDFEARPNREHPYREDDDGGTRRSPLASFAAHSDTSQADGAAVLSWDHEFDYGLWLVVDVESGPGLWVVDILDGARRYVSVPAADRARVVRWSVLVAAIVGMDGVWRTSAAVIHLSPAEGDMLAEIASRGIEVIGQSLAGGRDIQPRSLPTPGRQAPAGVAATSFEYAPSAEGDVVAKLVGLLLPGMMAAVCTWRSAGIDGLNTDGDELCLVEASLQVGDVEQACGKLVAHPDVEPDEASGGLVWWGAAIADDERRAMRASVRQLYGEDVEADLGVGMLRWRHGRVGIGTDTLEVEVNSRERLAAFVDLLRDVGLDPMIVKQGSLEPSRDLELRRGTPLPNHAMSEAEVEKFEAEWVDIAMPGLPGRSPYRAAKRAECLPVVESALRELEHDAARRARAGLPAPDVDSIREALGVRADDWLNGVGAGSASFG